MWRLGSSSLLGPQLLSHMRGVYCTIRAATSTSGVDVPQSSVHPDLVCRIQEILVEAPRNTLPIVALYDSLAPTMRRLYVKPHRTLFNALQLYQSSAEAPVFRVSEDGLMVHLSGASSNNSGVVHSPQSPPSTQRSKAPIENAPRAENPRPERTSWPADKPLPNPLLFPMVREEHHRTFLTCASPSSDFYFGVELTSVPQPPKPASASKAETSEGLDEAIANAFSVANFTPYIPTFFVSIAEVAQTLPEGYTEAHIDHYLSTAKTVQVVTVQGVRYIRIVGGYGQVQLDGTQEAAERFAKYKPNPELLPAFEKAFGGVVDRWMPLPILLQRAEPGAVDQLPFRGPAAILYFAQMQHRFNFSPDHDGAVLLRPPKFSGLTPETTPTPLTLSKVVQALPIEGFMNLEELAARVPTEVMENELVKFFPSLEFFLRSHGSVFHVSMGDEDLDVAENREGFDGAELNVCRYRFWERLQRKALPLHEQLAKAIAEKRKSNVRSIRRKMALLNSADSPLMNRETLAMEIHKALPRRGHVKLKLFMRGTLPDDILNFMPKNYQKFFSGFPELFQVFELHQATNWCIMRAGLNLPRGVLKKEYDDEDILRVVAAYLGRVGPRSASLIYLNIPDGAQKATRQRHVHLFNFVRKFPQYFSIVMPIDHGNAHSAAVIHLSQVPMVTSKDMKEEADSSEKESENPSYSDNEEGEEEDESIP